MAGKLTHIPIREVLHFLGWHGSPVDEKTLSDIRDMMNMVLREVQPRTLMLRSVLREDGALEGTTFVPRGEAVSALLLPCREAVLLAGTLGIESERLLLRMQARDAAKALLLDAVLSAAIEAVLDDEEEALRSALLEEGLYLTDRFSPGYGDMPLAQTKEICEVLSCARRMGLTVSHSGIMIPRKSVTAIMGISDTPVPRRKKGCATCDMRTTCAFCKA